MHQYRLGADKAGSSFAEKDLGLHVENKLRLWQRPTVSWGVVGKRVSVLPQYLVLVRSCLGSVVQRMEDLNRESPVEATQACQGTGACDTMTRWENCVSSYWGRDGEKAKQMLLIFTTA